MSSDNNIKKFTAIDIEKYHKGQLSVGEMNAMEKAAMDDPFLADALEGFGVAGVNAIADIHELKERLEERTAKTKVVPISNSRSRNQLLRVAVLIFFLAGAGLLIYQLGFKNKSEKNIAQVQDIKPGSHTTDTIRSSATEQAPANLTSTEETPKPVEGGKASTGETKPAGMPDQDLTVNNPVNKKQKSPEKKPDVTEREVTGGNVVSPKTNELAPPVSSQPIVSTQRGLDDIIVPATEDKSKPKKEVVNDFKKLKAQEESRDELFEKDFGNKTAGANRKDNQRQNQQQYNYNTFRGRVTDATNSGIPFANVSNPTDNLAGTYTDARGYFNLMYPDSVLNVQVKSIGFENASVQLRNNVPNNQVILKDDHSTLNEVTLSYAKPNTALRKAGDNMKIEEPEPEDGWEKYDTYLVNNLVTPKDQQGKTSARGVVELSFEVNKFGSPTDIIVTKSLCAACDKEAIRLVKEGPKWKRKAKKGRTTVKIPF